MSVTSQPITSVHRATCLARPWVRVPVHVPAGHPVEAHMWRCVGPSKVWYEWVGPSQTIARHVIHPCHAF